MKHDESEDNPKKLHGAQSSHKTTRCSREMGRNDALPRGNETVLLVEDDPALSRLLQLVLRRIGYRVFPAGNGIEGMNLYSEHKTQISMVISDIAMPKMDGIEMVTKLTEARPDLNILMISARPDMIPLSWTILKPTIALLEKPFSLSSLASTVREMLDGCYNPSHDRLNDQNC